MRRVKRLLRRVVPGARERAIAAAASPDDAFVPSSPLDPRDEDVQRWNGEWLDYLSREWPYQLEPYTAFPDSGPLPEEPEAVRRHLMRPGWRLDLHCDGSALRGRRVMELGCGCGNLGKLLGRYVVSYLGTDFSTLALQVARLVSPPNCTYVHVADRERLAPWLGTIETVVSRYFWIHQNLALARANLEFLAAFLVPGGRVYADFFTPDPRQEQFIVRKPDEPLSRRWPSAMFHYRSEDLPRLVEGLPFRIVREEVVVETQRRYVVLERAAS